MNELKPEDVMRAFDWQVSVANHIGSVTMSKEDINAIRAILREKDAEIKGLVDGWSKDQDQFEKQLADKDAEIERLKHSKGVAQVNIIDEIANHMRIKEFNSNEIATGYSWAINDLLKLLLKLKKKVMRGNKDGSNQM